MFFAQEYIQPTHIHWQKTAVELRKYNKVWELTLYPASVSPQMPSEYEANPELLFYRITHLNHRQQYLIWAAAVTTAGRGNFSDKVTVEPAAKGKELEK